MSGILSPIDVMLGQIGLPNGMAVRTCQDHGKFLVPKASKFTCPHCNGLHSTPDGTGGNGDTANIAEGKASVINTLKHFIHLG